MPDMTLEGANRQLKSDAAVVLLTLNDMYNVPVPTAALYFALETFQRYETVTRVLSEAGAIIKTPSHVQITETGREMAREMQSIIATLEG